MTSRKTKRDRHETNLGRRRKNVGDKKKEERDGEIDSKYPHTENVTTRS